MRRWANVLTLWAFAGWCPLPYPEAGVPRTPRMKRWDFYLDQKRSSMGFAKLMFGIAILAALAEFVTPVRMPAAVAFAIYAMWCFNASQWMQRFADQQARIDMLRVAKGMDPE